MVYPAMLASSTAGSTWLNMASSWIIWIGDSPRSQPGSTLLTQGVGELIILKRHSVCAPSAILRIFSNFAGEKNPKCHSINMR